MDEKTLEPNSLYLLFGDIVGVDYSDENIGVDETYSVTFNSLDSIKLLPGITNTERANRLVQIVSLCETTNNEALVRFVAKVKCTKVTRLQVRYITVKLR